MKCTLLVPGALLPESLAEELVRAIDAPRLVQALARARTGPDTPARERAGVHWSWLARRFGMSSDRPVTAPYAWHCLGADSAALSAEWIAHCEPVHLALSRDHLLLTDLADAPLQEAEAQELLALANGTLGSAAGAPAPLRLETRAGHWFLHCARELELDTVAFDAALGGAVQDRMPTGTDARRWRVLSNEIQMAWHASAANAAREERGARSVNALWLHGGGRWQALAGSTVSEIRADDGGADKEIFAGWLKAGAAAPRGAGDRISVSRSLFRSHAHAAWDAWLQDLRAFEDRLEEEIQGADSRGEPAIELVLCGARRARSFHVPVRRPFWHRLRGTPRDATGLLRRQLVESANVAGDAP